MAKKNPPPPPDAPKAHQRTPTNIAVSDIFNKAAKAAPIAKPKKSKTGDREIVPLGQDLDRLAAFRVLIDSLEGAAKQLQEELREKCYGIYAERATEAKSHPSSFVGQGAVATASVELRRRGSNMPISDKDVMEELAAAGIGLDENVRVPDRFIFNADLLNQEHIRKAISEAFGNHPILAPLVGELIQHQEKEFNWVTKELTLAEAAAKLSEDDYARLVPYLSTLAIGKFHLDGMPIVGGKGEAKAITPQAKALAIGMLQEMGVLPLAEHVKKK